MSSSDFLADFLRNAGGAAIIKDAAERVQDRPFATRADAEVGLRQALNRPDAAGVADNMLGAVGHQELKDWARGFVTPKPKTKDEAIAVLLEEYFEPGVPASSGAVSRAPSTSAARASTSEFLAEFLVRAGGAFVIKDAAERIQHRAFASRAEAETALRHAMNRPDAAELAAEMLTALNHQDLKDWAGELFTPKPKTKDEAIEALLEVYFGVVSDDDDDGSGDQDMEGDDEAFVGDEFLMVVIESCASAAEMCEIATQVCGERPRSGSAAYAALLGAVVADATVGTRASVLQACPASLLRKVCESLELGYTTKAEAIDDILDVCSEVDAMEDEDLEEDDATAPPISDAELIQELQPAQNPFGARPHQQVAIDGFAAERRPGRRLQAVIPTGGGKTLVGVEVAVRELAQGGRVLWVAMDWNLLWQAARDAAQRHDLFRKGKLGRVGGAMKNVRVLPENAGALRFGSVQTLYSRGVDKVLGAFRPTLVVWDECHLGQGGKLGTRLKKSLEKLGVPVLGLTATPKDTSRDGYEVLPGRKTFKELVEANVLASPVRVPSVPTGARVSARLNPFGDLDSSTIQELSVDTRRNRVIVDHWVARQGTYGKTILFACTIAHANTLCRMFTKEGVSARVVHSHQRPEDNETALKRFREGSVQLLLGVAMLTHGIDVPDARTIVLTRPTTSDILYAQMIGRGARRIGDKTTFNVVEFTDSYDQFHGKVYDCKAYFEGAGGMPVAPVQTTEPARSAPTPAPTPAPRAALLSAFIRPSNPSATVPVATPAPPPPAPPTPPIDATAPTTSGALSDIDLSKPPLPAPTCSRCTVALAPDQKFCHACGTKVVRAPTSCPGCQSPWREGAKFCGDCGTPAPT